MHNIFRDFEIQLDYPIQARSPYLFNYKRTCHFVSHAISADHKVKKKNKQKVKQILGFWQRDEKDI